MTFVAAVNGALLAFGPAFATNSAADIPLEYRSFLLRVTFFHFICNLVKTLAIATLLSPSLLSSEDNAFISITDAVMGALVIADILLVRYFLKSAKPSLPRLVTVAIGMTLADVMWRHSGRLFQTIWQSEFDMELYWTSLYGLTALLFRFGLVGAVKLWLSDKFSSLKVKLVSISFMALSFLVEPTLKLFLDGVHPTIHIPQLVSLAIHGIAAWFLFSKAKNM
eukprot:m.136714 g.136714  ORF g.136714 m.136714 type:complete len:223 (-) comp10866_c0_seq1:167-835(-)